MTEWTYMLFYAICFLPVAVIFVILPYIGRKTLSFGISIPSDRYADERLVKLRKSFASSVGITGALFTAVYAIAVILLAEYAVAFMSGLLLLLLVIVYALYIKRWRLVKALKEKEGWADVVRSTAVADTRFQTAKRAVSPAWFMLYALIIFASVFIGILLYDDMPGQVVQRIDFQGNVTQMASKSVGLVLFVPVTQAVMSIVFAFVYWTMLRTPPVLDPDNPEVSSRQNAVFRYRWSAFVVFGGAVMLLIFLALQLSFVQVIDSNMSFLLSMIGAGLFVVGAVVLAVWTGQSGSRVRMGRKKDGSTIRRDDDKYWRWGIVYVNKEDPALFVEKRFGVGFTINFGRPAAVVIIIGLLVFIIAAVVISAELIE